MSIESRSNQYGVVFDHWQIRELLGSGSGGKTGVFRLVHTEADGMQSALKVVNLIESPGSPSRKSIMQMHDYQNALTARKAQAVNEVQLMNDFQGNTNIVDYLDHKFVNWEDSTGFGCDMLIRMELLQDLRGKMNVGTRFDEKQIIRIGCDICQALIRCHGRGIVHRDIKPGNILVNRNGDYKLGDFGISRIISAASMSLASTNIGTPVYMAPEQSSGRYDHRVDIYSLGLVLYELSNGFRLPFASSTFVRTEDIEKRLMGLPMPAPRNASDALAAVILKACAFEPGERYQTALEMLEALRGCRAPAAAEREKTATADKQGSTPGKTNYFRRATTDDLLSNPGSKGRERPAAPESRRPAQAAHGPGPEDFYTTKPS